MEEQITIWRWDDNTTAWKLVRNSDPQGDLLSPGPSRLPRIGEDYCVILAGVERYL